MSEPVHSVTVRQETLPEIQPAERMIVMIMDAARDKSIDIDKLERLMAMQREMVMDQRRVEFGAVMAKIAPTLPRIIKRGKNDHQLTRYALLTDIDAAIRPILSAEGLFLSFDSGPVEGSPGKMRIFLHCSHQNGHRETIHIDLAIDKSGSKNETQAGPSTIAYGRTILTKMFFNLMTQDDNTDGGKPEFISPDQVIEINDLIKETKSNKDAFLGMIAGTDSVEAIPARDYKRIKNALDTKKRTQK